LVFSLVSFASFILNTADEGGTFLIKCYGFKLLVILLFIKDGATFPLINPGKGQSKLPQI